jgi:hypothetical protein
MSRAKEGFGVSALVFEFQCQGFAKKIGSAGSVLDKKYTGENEV